MLEDPTWTAKIRWSDWNGFHTSGHRPDLAVTRDGARVPIEVELARKSVERLTAILGLHARWRAARKTGGVIYVCADQAGCARVREIATAATGLRTVRGSGLRVERFETIKSEALAARGGTSSEQSGTASKASTTA